MRERAGRHDAAHARLLHARAEFPDDGSASGAALQVALAADALYDNDFAAMRRWSERAAQTAEALGDRGLLAVAQALVCFAEYALRGAQHAAPARIASAAGLDALPDELLATRLELPYYLGFAEYFCEQYEDAARHLRRGIELSRALGQGQYVLPMMVALAQALERLGRLREALGTAEAAVEASRLSGNPQAVGFALVAEAWTAAEIGDVEHARAAAEEAVALLAALDTSVLTQATHAHVGVIWLEIGEPDRCIEQLRAAGLPDFALIEPGRRGWLFTVLARAELMGGDREAAARGSLAPRRRCAGWSCRSPTPGCSTPARCSRSPRTTPSEPPRWRSRPQSARTRCARRSPLPAAGWRRASRSRRWATASRRCGCRRARSARSPPARPIGIGTRPRATSAASAGTSPRASAASPRGRGWRRSAAASSRSPNAWRSDATNRQIADELFLSQKTVEGHLTSVFAKLGVSSRAEVAEAVGRTRSPQH